MLTEISSKRKYLDFIARKLFVEASFRRLPNLAAKEIHSDSFNVFNAKPPHFIISVDEN